MICKCCEGFSFALFANALNTHLTYAIYVKVLINNIYVLGMSRVY